MNPVPAAPAAVRILLPLWLLSAVVSGCHRQRQAGDALHFVFITCVVDTPFFDPVKQGVQDAARAMGVDCEFTGTQGVDIPAQVAMVRQAIRQGCDGIALNIIDPTAFDAVIQEAQDKGIPVVGFNVDDHATPNARLSCVSQRLFEAGQVLARHLLPEIPEQSHVLMTMHDEGVSALEDRLRGLQSVLRQKQITWTTLVTGSDSARGADLITATLKHRPDIRIILGTGQSDTEAAGLALERNCPGDACWSAGFDLSPTTLRLIKAGLIRCTVDQQPYIQGFYPVVQLAHYCRYGLSPADMDAGATIIDQTNVDTVLALTAKGYR